MSEPAEPDRLTRLAADEPLPPGQLRTGRDRRAGDAEIIVTGDAGRLLRLLGPGWESKLADALEDVDKHAVGWPGSSSVIKITRQGGKVVDIEGPPRKYRVLKRP